MEPHPSASLGSAAWKAAVLDGLLMRHIGVDDGSRTHKNLCVGNAMLYQLSYIHIYGTADRVRTCAYRYEEPMS